MRFFENLKKISKRVKPIPYEQPDDEKYIDEETFQQALINRKWQELCPATSPNANYFTKGIESPLSGSVSEENFEPKKVLEKNKSLILILCLVSVGRLLPLISLYYTFQVWQCYQNAFDLSKLKELKDDKKLIVSKERKAPKNLSKPHSLITRPVQTFFSQVRQKASRKKNIFMNTSLVLNTLSLGCLTPILMPFMGSIMMRKNVQVNKPSTCPRAC